MTDTPTVLELDGVSVRTRLGGQPIDVLQDISFALRRGAVLGMIGESGAGKSMIGRTVMGELPPGFTLGAGRILLSGRRLDQLAPAARRSLCGRDIAFIPQDPQSALNPVTSIGAQFAEHLARLQVPRGQRRRRALAQLESVEIAEPDLVLRKFPHELSGGMCQRVLIAMAFAAKPSLIIADEPTTALDAMSQARVVDLLRGLQLRSGTSVIFITHDLRLASHVCDDVMVLYAGQPVEYGPAREIFSNPRHPYTRSLQASNPSLKGPLMRLPRLPDHMPGLDAFARISGCRFSARGGGDLQEVLPPPSMVGPGHWVRATQKTLALGIPSGTPRPSSAEPKASATPLLRVAEVFKRYTSRTGLFGGRRTMTAVDDVSLALQPGEFLGIVGLSGSGKSTLARMLVGLERPDSGAIEIDGEDATGDDFATRSKRVSTIQMIFQNSQSSLNPRRRIGELVTQGFDGLARLPDGERRYDIACRLLAEVGLPRDVIDRFPMQLSGGQRQRVGIARALCLRPRIILADEIVSGLDVSVQAQVMNLLLDLREQLRISMIFITHDLSVVRYLCDRTIVMRAGAIVEEGPTEALLADPQHAYTRALIDAVPPEDPAEKWIGLDRAAVA